MLLCTVTFWEMLPPEGRIIGIFIGALPGSRVYGITFSYLEGRKSTDALNAFLSLIIVWRWGDLPSSRGQYPRSP